MQCGMKASWVVIPYMHSLAESRSYTQQKPTKNGSSCSNKFLVANSVWVSGFPDLVFVSIDYGFCLDLFVYILAYIIIE